MISPKKSDNLMVISTFLILEFCCMTCVGWAQSDTWKKNSGISPVFQLAQGKISIQILDKEKNMPVSARVHIMDTVGNLYAPEGSLLRYTYNGDGYFYTNGQFEIDVPPGIIDIITSRGLEYNISYQQINIIEGENVQLDIVLERWINMAAQGWYSGDGQVNANPFPRPESPYIVPDDVLLMLKGEDLNLVNLMAIGPGDCDREFFEGKPNDLSESNHIFYYNQEYRSWIYGHLTLFSLTEWLEPNVSGMGSNQWDYPPNSDICDMVHQQGGFVSYSHPAYKVDPMHDVYEDSDVLFAATELPVDLALGKVDAINLMGYISSDSVSMKLWYKLLNCGFKLPAIAGTDCYLNQMDIHWASSPMGGERAYVSIQNDFSYDTWVEGLMAGQSFVTNGPMIFITVNGKSPGEIIDVPAGTNYSVSIEASAVAAEPLRKFEIIVNGKVVESNVPQGNGTQATISTNILLEKSSWIAARCTGDEHQFVYPNYWGLDGSFFAHTNPVYCYLRNQPILSTSDVNYFIDWIENLIQYIEDPSLVADHKNVADFESEQDKERLISIFRQALDVYKNMLVEHKIFTDVASNANVTDSFDSEGVACADFDADGDLDFYVANGGHNLGQANRLYRNDGDTDGDGIYDFTDIAASVGVGNVKASWNAGFADFDNDGDKDIFITNGGYYSGVSENNRSNVLYRNNLIPTGILTFTDISAEAGVDDVGEGRSAAFADYNNDGYIDIYVANATVMGAPQNNVLYYNNGDGTFSDKSEQAGVADASVSVGTAFGDYNDDNYPDLYISNYGDGDKLYHNNGDGTFSDVTATAGINNTAKATGCVFGDYDEDGDLDIYVTNADDQNILYRNAGDGTFTNSTQQAAVGNGNNVSYGCNFFDFDNDGDLDLFVTNIDQPDALYRNNGDRTFTNISVLAGVNDAGKGLSTTIGDYNNDGFLDIYLTKLSPQSNVLYRNISNLNNWLAVEAIGAKSNKDGIGAKVKVVTGTISQIRYVNGGDGYCSQSSLPAEFGIGKFTLVDTVEIRWPSGIIQVLTELDANQVVSVTEQDPGTDVQDGVDRINLPVSFAISQNFPNPFNLNTVINYQLPDPVYVSLVIYDILGRRLKTLVANAQQAGYYSVIWDGLDNHNLPVTTGIYIYKIQAGNFVSFRKMIILK